MSQNSSIKAFKILLLSALLSISFFPKVAFADKSVDERSAIWLSDSQRSTILAEMRQFLSASQTILQAALDEDMQKVEQIARSVGLKQARGVSAELSNKLPQGFVALGPKVHMGFEEIADEAATMGDAQVVLQRLAELQTFCIKCHAAYRLERE